MKVESMRGFVRRLTQLAVAGLLVSLSPVSPASARETPSIAERAADLRPGQFAWNPDASPQGDVEIVVSLPQQRAYVYRGGALIGVSTVSTGRAGYETPTGTFNILQKARVHHSNLYESAPMPFMQRLTWDGVALHAGEIPGTPASHGCIRLPRAFAEHLFAATEVGAAVHVTDMAPSPGEALAMVRAAPAYTGMGGPEEEVSDTGN